MKHRILAALVLLFALATTYSIGGEPDTRDGPPKSDCPKPGEGDDGPNQGQGGPDGTGNPDELNDPVFLPRGEYVNSRVDFRLPGRGLDVYLERTYRSRSRVSTGLDGGPRSAMGLNWSHNYEMWVGPVQSDPMLTSSLPSTLFLYLGNERMVKFTTGSTSTTPVTYEAQLYPAVIESESDSLPVYYITDDNTVYKFHPLRTSVAGAKAGMLDSITDRNGNVVTLTYESGYLRDRILYVSDALGNRLDFYYYDDTNAPSTGIADTSYLGDLLWKVVDHTGRAVEYLYEFSDENCRTADESCITTLDIRQLTEVVLPAHTLDSGVFDLPSEHVSFPSGRSIKYEYFPDPSTTDPKLTGLLTKITDENGVEILENFYENPLTNEYDDVPDSRRLYKQVFAGDTYTHMRTSVDGSSRLPGVDSNSYAVWVQKRNGTVVKLVYSASHDYVHSKPDGTHLLSRTDYPSPVPSGQRGKVVWLDETGPQWKYADTPSSTTVGPFSMPPPVRAGAVAITKIFEHNTEWKQTGFTNPDGDAVAYVYNESASDPRARQALNQIISKPAGTILDGMGEPLTTHSSWITKSYEYDGFSFWGTGGGCSCGAGRFATAIVDGEGNRTEKVYETTNAPGLSTPTGNLLYIYHDIPSAHAGIEDDTTRRSHAAAVEAFTYTTGGNIATHTHPATTRLVSGVATSYTRVDEFEYYSDTYGTTDAEIASRGKLHIQRIDADIPEDTTREKLETVYEYDAIGNISRIIEPDGDVTTYLYNQGRQLVRTQRWDDSSETTLYAQTDYFYDANGNVVIEQVKNLDSAQAVVAANPRITTVYEYNDRDQLTKMSVERADLLDESITLGSPSNKAVAPTGSDWVKSTWDYDANGNLIREKSSNASATTSTTFSVVEYEYDFRDLLYRKIEGAGTSSTLVTQYNYDDSKRLIERIVNPDGAALTEVLDYDGHSRLMSITDPMGNVAIIDYDKNNNRTEIEVLGPYNEDKNIGGGDTPVVLYHEEFEYDSRDRMIERDLSVFDYLSGSISTVEHQITEYTYNDDSSIRQIDAPLSNTTEFFYDSVGRRSHVIDDAGNEVAYQYDDGSNLTQVDMYDLSTINATSQHFVTSFIYDPMDRRILVEDGVENQTKWGYDSRSNRVSEITARGNLTSFDFDGLSRLIATRVKMTADGDGPADGMSIDTVLDSSNPEILTEIEYDSSNRVIAEIDDNGQRTEYTYDSVNRRTAITMPDTKQYTFAYNANGQMSLSTDARGINVSHGYDKNNRLTVRSVYAVSPVPVPEGSLREEFVYDGLGRVLSAKNYPVSTFGTATTTITRAYDSRGFVVRETQNVVGEADRTVNYEYDLANNPIGILYPHGRDIHRSYDSINRLVSIADHEPMTPMAIADFDYFGRRLERRTNGNTTETAYQYDGFDGATPITGDFGFGRLVGITTTSGMSTLDDFAFTWDQSQNRSSYNDIGSGMKNRRERTFGYDSSDRLISTDVDFPDTGTDYTSPTNGGVTDYDLDGVHNRFEVTGFEGAGAPIGDYKDVAVDLPDHVKNNQYTFSPRAAGGQWRYTYDGNGNMTEKVEYNASDINGDYELDYLDVSAFLDGYENHTEAGDLNGDGEWDALDISIFTGSYTVDTKLDNQVYTYDFRNQLVSVQFKSGSLVTPQLAVTNTYDAFARRLVEESDVLETEISMSLQFVYGGASLWEVIEQIQLVDDTNLTEKLSQTHVYGLGIDDEVSYRLENLMTPEDYWSHRDDLNSLTSITDDAGDVKERYQYGDYGQVTIFDPATGDERAVSDFGVTHLYTGRSLITGTGLFDYRFRVMDPETGRFRQRDPLGYIDSMNMYTYVTSNPNLYIDPYGLSNKKNNGGNGNAGSPTPPPPGLIPPPGPNGERTYVIVKVPMARNAAAKGLMVWLAGGGTEFLDMYYHYELLDSNGQHIGYGDEGIIDNTYLLEGGEVCNGGQLYDASAVGETIARTIGRGQFSKENYGAFGQNCESFVNYATKGNELDCGGPMGPPSPAEAMGPPAPGAD